MGSRLGVEKIAASRVGLSLGAYRSRISAGEKWCTACKSWHTRDRFGPDVTRGDGLSAACTNGRSTGNPIGWQGKRPINPASGRPGPVPHDARNGDKIQARHKVNLEVASGRLAAPNDFPCTDCGHVWSKGERRHEYDHYLGYAAEHHLDVQPVCTKCHHQRDNPHAKQTHCKSGHEFTEENTGIRANSNRFCKACRRAHDRSRGRDAAYWREYRREKLAGRMLDGVTHDGYPKAAQ